MPRPLTEAEIEAEKAYILSTSAPMPGPLTEAEKEKQRADAPPLGIPRYVPPDAPADSDLPREGPALGMDKYDSASSTRELADAKRDQAIQERIRAQHGEDRPEELVQAEIKRELDRYGILGPLGPVDPETAENLEDAYTSPDTLAKKRARMAAGAFPIPIREPGAMERDARWQPGATKLSQEGVLSLVSGISAKHAEPSPAEEVVDKSWARALARSATSAATGLFAGLSPVDSAVRWFTGGEYDIPLVPSLGETFALPSKLADVREGLEGLTTDPDVRLDPVKVASRVVLALAGGEGVSAQLKVLGADPDEVAIWDEAIERATPIPEFDAAWKALYEEGDSSAMEEVPYHSLPASLQGGLDLALVRRAVTPGGALYDRPEAALLQRAVERGEDELLVEREASELPISVLRWLSPLSVPTNKQITDEGQKRAKMQELTGIGDTAKAVRLLTAMTVDKEDGQLYFTPSPIQRALSWAGVTGEVLWEADIPLNIGGVNLGSLVADALGYEQLARMIGTARIPTKAGWETWVATGSLDPYLHERGWRGSRAPLLRPGAETTWMGRVGANVAFADYQGPGLADALRRQGEPPQSALSKFALAVDVAVDVLMPIDELVFGGLATPAVGARRAWVAGNTASRAGLRGGRLAKAAAAGVVPALVGETDRLGALDKVVREGLDAELRAGHRLFGENVRGDKPPPPHEDPGSVDWKLQRDIARKIEAAGYRPEEAAAAVNAVADENARELWNATARGLKNRGGPADVALRTAPGYAAVRARYDDLAAAGNVTPRQADVTMAMLESLAWKAVGEGKYATPEEFFDAHAVELGGTPGAGAYFQKAPETPEFRNWFGASKVVDPEGKPLVVYHGSSYGDIRAFDPDRADSSGLYGPGFYFTDDPLIASSYTGKAPPRVSRAEIEAHFTPGRIVEGYAGKDRVLAFDGDDPRFPWRVQVERVDDAGNAIEPPRWHFTEPQPHRIEGRPGPGVLPTYLRVQRPFDIEAKLDAASRNAIVGAARGHPALSPGQIAEIRRKLEPPANPVQEGPDAWRVAGWPIFRDDAGLYHTAFAPREVFASLDDAARATTAPVYATGADAYDAIVGTLADGIDEPKRVANEILQSAGYDGITHVGGAVTGGKPHRVYIAFRPEQIKSATANRGTFDPTDPSILRDPSGGPAAAATYTPPVPPADLPPRLAADTWGDTRGPLGWWMPLDEVEDALHGLVEEFIVLYDGAGRQVARWGPEDTRVAGADPAVNCVVYSSALDALARTGDGVYTHVHPSGAPFSPEDLLVARRANVAEIRAVADGDGFTWVVKRPTGGWPDPAAMQSAYNEAAVPATGVATRQMDDIVRAAGGDITDGRNARGYDKQTWRRLYARALSDTWNDAFARTGIVAERVPNRGAERMGAGVRPAGDAPGAGPEALDLAARRGATPVGEQVTLLEPTAPAFPPRKDGTAGPPRTVTLFSGGGLIEVGLRGLIDPVMAVESEPAIAAVHKAAHQSPIRVGKVQDVDLTDAGEVDYLHASPVCKNASKANLTGDGEQPLDIATATATAKAIREKKPRVFTLENVSGYADFDAMRLIEDALRGEGYTFDARIYDAADYGAATHRKRLLLRAVKDGPLPPPPSPTHGLAIIGKPYADWYATVADIVEALPDSTLAPWMRARIEKAGIDPEAPGKPLIVMGGSAGKNVPFAFAGGPAPTLKAAHEAHKIILPDGRVKDVTPQVMARITGLPDDYPLPKEKALATTIIGNGVPPALSKAVFGPLLVRSPEVPKYLPLTPQAREAVLYEGQPLFERRAAAVLGSIEPTSAARWLLRYFATADIGTVLHENAHLMRFVMGDKWVDELVRFLPNEPDPARPGKLRLTRAGEERFAEGFGRLLRGKIAPRGRLRAYYDEFKDRLADLWMRLRGLPLGVSPDLRRWFDAAFNPGGPLKRVLIDRPVTPEGRLPGRPVRTTVEADVPTRLEAEGVKRTGQVLGDVSTMDSPGAAIDVVAGSRSAREIDAVQAAINAIADTVVETARRQWGFTGDVTKLTRRTHVPKARVERVLRKVDNLFRAIHGKDLVVEADAVRLDPVSAAKMEAHVAMLADSGMGFEALRGSDLLDPDYDFTEMPLEDYNRIREATIDRDAGPGTRADRVAAQNVGNAAYGLLKFISDSGPAGGAIAGAAVGTVVAGPGAGTLIGALGGAFLYSERASGEIKAAFTVNFRVAEYTNPTVVDLFGETTRELGGITGLFKRALDDVGRTNPEAMRHELVTRIARSMPAMSVQVPDIPEMLDLHRVWVEPFTERVAKEPVLADLLATLDNVAGFVARNPAIARTTQESEQQAVLALAGYRADPRDIGLLAPTERAAIEDAVGILHDALRRRGEAVKKAGAEIGIAMSGSDEKKLWVGLHRDKNPWAQLEKAAEFYQKFYDGDWNGILKETAAVGQATAPPAFDPVAAAAAAITRMMALDVLNRFATKMMDAGIALDVDTAARLGRQFETFRPIGSTDASGLDRAAFRDEVLRVIQAEMSFKMIGADVVDMAHRKKVASDPAPGTLGSFSPDAYRVGLSILSSWGFKPGADTAWKALVLGDGTEVMVPEGLWGELTGVMDRAAKAGLAWAARGEAQPVLGRWYNVEGIAQKMEGAKATVTGAVAARAADREDTLNRRVARVAQGILDVAGWSYTMSRVNMVTGVGIPNPANFIGNLLGGAVQLYEGKGAIGALRVLGRYVAPTASGKVLRHVFLSLFNDYRGIRAPGLWRPSAVWIDGRGGVHTGESLANQARKTGLHSSQARAESTWKLVDALRRNEGTRWKRITKDFSENNPMGAAMRQFVVRPFNWWQDALMEASTAIDNLYRVGSFIDELSIGKGADEAAETARRVAFDYNAVTDFEREVIRPAVMFYTYMRRNLDLQWWTLLNHPSRFLGTLRGIRDAQEIVLGKESELIWPEYLDGRLILAMRKTASDSNQYGAYSGVARIAPLIGVSDAVVLMARILGTVTGDAEGRRELMAMLSPWYQSVIVAATGYDIWSGRDVAAFNTVPAWLVELDQQAFDGLLTTDLFDVDAMEERDPMSEANPGESHFQARNARYWWAFRNLMPIGGGRTVDTVTAMARADWLAFAFEGGIVTAAVEAAQEHRASGRARLTDPLVSLVRDGIDWLPGINPYPDRSYAPSAAPDVEERRVGMKESEELGGLFAIKSVRVPTRVLRLDDLSKKSAREAEAAARLQERSEPY